LAREKLKRGVWVGGGLVQVKGTEEDGSKDVDFEGDPVGGRIETEKMGETEGKGVADSVPMKEGVE